VNEKCELKNILITGGCGFIGTNLAKYLLQRGCKVRILDNLSTNSSIWLEKKDQPAAKPKLTQKSQGTEDPVFSDIDLIVGDTRDEEVVEKAAGGMDAVVHLAAHTGVVDSLENPKENWDVNVNGTINLLESCRRKGVGRFIFASSSAAVGEQNPPIDELKVPQPISPYGASKLAGEALCSAYYYSFGLNTICLRFSNCYGPYYEHKGSVIARFLNLARKGEPLIIYGDGNQTRDFIHVDDVCQAIHLALIPAQPARISRETTPWGEVFQIASGIETSINKIADIMKERMGEKVPIADSTLSIVHQPKRKGEIERNYSDITKAKKILGFQPRVKLREGLEELCSPALENRPS